MEQIGLRAIHCLRPSSWGHVQPEISHPTTHPTLGTIPITPKKPDTTLIRPIVSQCLGVLRHAADMHRAIAALLPFVEGEEESSDPAIVALLIAIFAHLRTESRGAHARTDFPSQT